MAIFILLLLRLKSLSKCWPVETLGPFTTLSHEGIVLCYRSHFRGQRPVSGPEPCMSPASKTEDKDRLKTNATRNLIRHTIREVSVSMLLWGQVIISELLYVRKRD